MTYVEYGGSIYLSNGTDRLRIAGGVAIRWPCRPRPVQRFPPLAARSRESTVRPTPTTRQVKRRAHRRANDLLLTAVARRYLWLYPVRPHQRLCLHDQRFSAVLRGLVSSARRTDVAAQATAARLTNASGAPPAGELFLFNGMLCSFKGAEVFEGIRPGPVITYRSTSASRKAGDSIPNNRSRSGPGTERRLCCV